MRTWHPRTILVPALCLVLLVFPAVAAERDDPDPSAEEVKQALSRKMTLEFVDEPARDVLAFIEETSGVAIIIPPDVEIDAPMTLSVKDISTEQALMWALELVGLRMDIRDGAVHVTTQRPPKPPEGQRGARITYSSGRPGRQIVLHQILSGQDRRVVELLKQKVSFEFHDTPLADVAKFIHENYGLDIVIDAAKVDATRRLGIQLSGLQLGDALHWVARLAGTQLALLDGAVFVVPGISDRTPLVTVDSEAMKRIRDVLREDAALNLTEAPLSTVVRALRDMDMNVVIAPDVNLESTVTIRVEGEPLGESLHQMLAQVGARMSVQYGAVFIQLVEERGLDYE